GERATRPGCQVETVLTARRRRVLDSGLPTAAGGSLSTPTGRPRRAAAGRGTRRRGRARITTLAGLRCARRRVVLYRGAIVARELQGARGEAVGMFLVKLLFWLLLLPFRLILFVVGLALWVLT